MPLVNSYLLGEQVIVLDNNDVIIVNYMTYEFKQRKDPQFCVRDNTRFMESLQKDDSWYEGEINTYNKKYDKSNNYITKKYRKAYNVVDSLLLEFDYGYDQLHSLYFMVYTKVNMNNFDKAMDLALSHIDIIHNQK